MAYIYNADIYCDACGRAVKARLDAEGKCPSYPPPWDSDDYPVRAADGGESNCPQHCGHCRKYLRAPLDEEGVAYVLSTIRESIASAVEHGRASEWDRIMPLTGTGEDTPGFRQTWAGRRHVEILRAWA